MLLLSMVGAPMTHITEAIPRETISMIRTLVLAWKTMNAMTIATDTSGRDSL
jgi:hypothetical protein